MIRVPIGGTDFSTHKYAYGEHPAEGDPLKNFALTSEDYELKVNLMTISTSIYTKGAILLLGIFAYFDVVKSKLMNTYVYYV